MGKISGQIPGLFTAVDEDHPHPERVHWAEAARVSIGRIDGKDWLLLDPDVWIWPARAREDATDFLDTRRGNRFNNISNALLDAWLTVLCRDLARLRRCSVQLGELEEHT